MWDKYRAEFPITENYIYMNHAAVGPLSTRVKERIDFAARLMMEQGSLCFQEIMEHIGEVRKNAAALIGASPEEIAFVKNTTSGVLLAAGGVRWEEGDNLVLPACEFPANVYPWLPLEMKGVEVRMAPDTGGRVSPEAIRAECDSRTRLVTVSMVQYGSGYRIDLEELGEFCRQNGILLHVDGIQGVGALDIDISRLKVDFLSAGGHKWLLSAGGAGIFYCRKELIEKLEIPNPGWTGVRDFMDFSSISYDYREDCTRFEEGTLNALGILALGSSLERFLDIGMEQVETRILSLTSSLARALAGEGYTVTSPFGEGERSGILTFVHPDREAEMIFENLISHNVTVSLRGGAVRISPHFYNTEDEISSVMEILG